MSGGKEAREEVRDEGFEGGETSAGYANIELDASKVRGADAVPERILGGGEVDEVEAGYGDDAYAV